MRALYEDRFPVHTILASDYPELFRVHLASERLFVQGHPDALKLLDRLPDRGLAVVGTRAPQARCQIQVRETVAALAGADLVILSGLARGIDAWAHEAACLAGLPTIAFLGCGHEQPYPAENLELRRRILECGGLVISEFAPGSEARPHHFLLRNRLIARFGRAVWVAQAAHRSGALNTAQWAKEMDVSIYATPGFPGDPAMAGNQRLLDSGHAHAVWGAHSFAATWLELHDRDLARKRAFRRAKRLEPEALARLSRETGISLSALIRARESDTLEA